jgi:hypothetical protein
MTGHIGQVSLTSDGKVRFCLSADPDVATDISRLAGVVARAAEKAALEAARNVAQNSPAIEAAKNIAEPSITLTSAEHADQAAVAGHSKDTSKSGVAR